MSEERTVVINRVFDAPVEKVWAAWSDPALIKKWWGPKNFTAPHAEIDFRVGGKYLYAMHGPAGTEFDKDMWNTGTYQEIVPLQKIVYADSFADENGNVVPSSAYGMPGMSEVMLLTITFEALDDGKTKVTIVHTGAPEGGIADNMEAGWNQSLDKMAESLR
jgi:uncharacterized protein YndB with AHSA1/START domain